MGGISFVIIKFLKYDKVFLIDISSLVKFKDKIPYTYFKDNVSEIKLTVSKDTYTNGEGVQEEVPQE